MSAKDPVNGIEVPTLRHPPHLHPLGHRYSPLLCALLFDQRTLLKPQKVDIIGRPWQPSHPSFQLAKSSPGIDRINM